jgi:peptidoglycan/xylan/chitin deacetylase (PgdA/CDA1 family)
MYHSIADDGPAELVRYRTTPAAFDAQLGLLKRKGFHGIGSRQLARHLAANRPFRGRPVLLTFDDGYRDFATTAAPILRKHGLTADVFLVSDKVGGTADWDTFHAPSASLMDWGEIAGLAAQGIAFGSHLATHRPVDSLSADDLLREAARSKAEIEMRLGQEVTSVAIPHGIYDFRVIPALQLCGYRLGFSTNPRIATLADLPLQIPRIEVRGDWRLGDFAEALEPGPRGAGSG